MLRLYWHGDASSPADLEVSHSPINKSSTEYRLLMSSSPGRGVRRRKKVISAVMFCALETKILPLENSISSEFDASEKVM